MWGRSLSTQSAVRCLKIGQHFNNKEKLWSVWDLASLVVVGSRQTGIAGDRLLFAGGTTKQYCTCCIVTYPAIQTQTAPDRTSRGNSKLTSPGQDCSPGGHEWLCASWCFYPSAPRRSPAETDGWSASAWSPHCLHPRWSILDNHPEVATNREDKTHQYTNLTRSCIYTHEYKYINLIELCKYKLT